MKPNMNITTAAEAHDFAVEWQHWMSEQNLSYGEMIEWESYFEGLAERFPELREEFTENGIIGANSDAANTHVFRLTMFVQDMPAAWLTEAELGDILQAGFVTRAENEGTNLPFIDLYVKDES